MKPVIEVNNISKSYSISHQNNASYGTLKDDFGNLLKKPFRQREQDKKELFWALKDLSFQVNPGEIFGVIGKNGSGKSTLLKILSRIVDPTSGDVRMRGRVASLLEVGTGFHPELTGRENIFFNGSMIGMSRQEIRQRFDEIVQFSEIEKFIDTPVKFYSSGMYVRLAFAVAAHLEPDVLILDEVLSVGDAGFQRKSLNKIISTMESGCTVLIVSHSAETLRKLCKNGLLLSKGRIKSMGPIDQVLFDYTETISAQADPRSTILPGVRVDYTQIKDEDKLRANKPLEAEIVFHITETLPNCTLNFLIDNSAGNYIVHARKDIDELKKGKYKVTLNMPRLSVNKGLYSGWFRFTAQKKYGQYALDAERQVLQVGGPDDEMLAAVDVLTDWHQEKMSK